MTKQITECNGLTKEIESLQEQLGTESKEAVEQHIQALADHMQDLDKAFQTAKKTDMKNATHAGRI